MINGNRLTSFAGALVIGLTVGPPAVAGNTVKVEMLDKGPNGKARVFRPALVHIEPGDTVNFVATDFGHDVTSVDGLQPKGAKGFDGYKNAPLKVTLEKPGVHIYECESHRKKGMVGAIVVGDASVNLADIQSDIRSSEKISDKGEKRLIELLAKINTDNQGS